MHLRWKTGYGNTKEAVKDGLCSKKRLKRLPQGDIDLTFRLHYERGYPIMPCAEWFGYHYGSLIAAVGRKARGLPLLVV
jgi:hypothetical protein